eukprot:6048285-Alexandrium_andersonii.AAC.1
MTKGIDEFVQFMSAEAAGDIEPTFALDAPGVECASWGWLLQTAGNCKDMAATIEKHVVEVVSDAFAYYGEVQGKAFKRADPSGNYLKALASEPSCGYILENVLTPVVDKSDEATDGKDALELAAIAVRE